MNNKVKFFGFFLIVFLFGLLIFKSWGEPISELEKSKFNEISIVEFNSITNTSWKNNKNDNSSSEISFYIDGLKDTKGFFKDFDIIFKVSDIPEKSKIKVSIPVESINTDNELRDETLMGEEFFNSEKFPVIEFHSKDILKSKSKYKAIGEMNMMGINSDFSFLFDFNGITKNKNNQNVAIFEGEFTIDRTDFGMINVATVGDEVKIRFYCELIKF